MPWYVIYTKPKTEIKVAEALRILEIVVYCPLITEIRQWSDRKKKVTIPLFRSYVFVHLEPKDRRKVFEVPGVLNYLFWLGKHATVSDEEIKVIKDWNGNSKVDQMSVEEFSPGDKIVISHGVFKKQHALIRHVNKKRMRLLLPGLGYAISIKTREVVTNKQ